MDVGSGDVCERGVGKAGQEYDYNPDNWNVVDYYNTGNTYCAIYQEHIPGYMAGYAAAKVGYRHLGLPGGMSVPAMGFSGIAAALLFGLFRALSNVYTGFPTLRDLNLPSTVYNMPPLKRRAKLFLRGLEGWILRRF